MIAVNPSDASPVYMYMQDPKLVTAVAADGLAPHGARPSAGTALTTKLYLFPSKYLWQSIIAINFPGPGGSFNNTYELVNLGVL